MDLWYDKMENVGLICRFEKGGPEMGDFIVLGIVAVCLALALRAIHRDRKAGKHCGGCSGCSGCSGGNCGACQKRKD